MSLRKTTSLTTLLSFILLMLTGAILYIRPQGRIAHWTDWRMLGLDKEQWEALHTNLGFLFIVAGVTHTILNWKPIVAYLKNKASKLTVFTPDFNVAAVLTLLIVLFTLFELQPVRAIQDFNQKLMDAAARRYGDPPYGQAETSTLASFCRRTGLDLEESLSRLETAGLKAVSAEATLQEMAEANGMTPQEVYEALGADMTNTGQGGGRGQSGRGFGRKTLSDICAEEGFDVQTTLAGLRRLGIDAAAGDTMRDIADTYLMEPQSVLEAIRQVNE
jgi:hypothetical protein